MADPQATPFQQLVLGESTERVAVDTSDAVRAATVAMLRQARRRVDIVSRHLDPPVYDDAECVAALREFALRTPRARARILVLDPAPVVSRGHRLLELVRRLTSFLEMRIPAEEHSTYNSAFLVVDGRGVLFRVLSDRYDGVACFNDPAQANELGRAMDEMWEVAGPDPNLRALKI